MDDFVSIITPAYQAEAFIHLAVKSVLAQSHANWELIIVSDDQQDYAQILRERGYSHPRFRFFTTGSIATGPNVARNIGLENAKGDWIAPLDADDIYYPRRLEKLIEAGRETGLSLDNAFITSGKNFAEKERVLNQASNQFGFQDFKKSLVPLLFLFDRNLVSQGWDEDIKRGADTLFNLRGIEAAGYAVLVDEPLHEYRVHNTSMCHAPGSDKLFIEAYRYTLERLKTDGLGFSTESFKSAVIQLITSKERINSEFNRAIENGFEGNYQDFVADQGLR